MIGWLRRARIAADLDACFDSMGRETSRGAATSCARRSSVSRTFTAKRCGASGRHRVYYTKPPRFQCLFSRRGGHWRLSVRWLTLQQRFGASGSHSVITNGAEGERANESATCAAERSEANKSQFVIFLVCRVCVILSRRAARAVSKDLARAGARLP